MTTVLRECFTSPMKPRDTNIVVRLTSAEKRQLVRAAKNCKVSLSGWVRVALLAACQTKQKGD